MKNLIESKIARIYFFICRIDDFLQELIAAIAAIFLPIKLAYACAIVLGTYEFIACRYIQGERLEDYFKNAGIKTSNLKKLGRDYYINIKKCLIEEYMLAFKGKKFLNYLNKNTEIIGIENFSRVFDEHKGFIVSMAHIGNMYLAIWKFGEYFSKTHKNIKINIIKLKPMLWEKYANRLFKDIGLNVSFSYTYDLNIGLQIYKCLKKGEIVVLLSDMDVFYRNTQRLGVSFLNHNFQITIGTAFLAAKTKSTILPIYFVRDFNSKFKLIIHSPIFSEISTLEYLTKAIIATLEQEILKNPAQWHKWNRLPLFMEKSNEKQ
jgi:lauroyl/myristoyl acyltransferase